MCKEAKVLLAISALFNFAIGLSNIFVNVFFWKQSSDFIVIALYNLIQYVTIPITFVLAGMLAKKKDGVWPLRIGLLIFAVFFMLILLLGNKSISYIYLLGIINGMALGFYWLAFNTLSFDFTHINNRDNFNGFNGCYAGIAAAISPLPAAYIISIFSGMKGYYVVFALTLATFVILILMSMLLKCKSYGRRLDFRKAFARNGKEWSIVRTSASIWGFRDLIIVFLINILTIEATNSELSLGTLTFIGAIISSGAYVLAQKVIRPPHRKLSILIGTIGSFIAVLGLAAKVVYGTLVFYIIMNAFFLPFFLIQLNSAIFNVIDQNHEGSMRIEYMINRELVLNTGRAVSALILIILLTLFKTSAALKGYLLFLGLVPIASGYSLGRLREVLGDMGFKESRVKD